MILAVFCDNFRGFSITGVSISAPCSMKTSGGEEGQFHMLTDNGAVEAIMIWLLYSRWNLPTLTPVQPSLMTVP